jgi:hypothetical protein
MPADPALREAEPIAQMGHCIATCARSAVAGDCYLFHVEHRSEPQPSR